MFHIILFLLGSTLSTGSYPGMKLPETSRALVRRDESGLLTGNELLDIGRRMCDAIKKLVDLINNPLFGLLGLSDLAMNMPLPIPRWVLNPFNIVSFTRFIKKTILDFINKANVFKLDLGKRSYPPLENALFEQNNDQNSYRMESKFKIPNYKTEQQFSKILGPRNTIIPGATMLPHEFYQRIQKRQEQQEEEKQRNQLVVQDVIELFKVPCELIEFTQSIFNDTPLAWVGVGDWPLLLRDIKNELNLLVIPNRIFNAIFKGK